MHSCATQVKRSVQPIVFANPPTTVETSARAAPRSPVGLSDGEDRKDYTLDIDVTLVMAEKQAAAWTYKGERGYAPMVGHLAENGLVIGDEFREGNDAPQSRNLEFIQHCATQLPKGKRIAFLRADSAAYQAAIFNWCDEKGVQFAVGGDMDVAVKAVVKAIPAGDWQAHEDGLIAETVHCMGKTNRAFRLVVIRRPVQLNLLTGAEEYSGPRKLDSHNALNLGGHPEGQKWGRRRIIRASLRRRWYWLR